MDALAVRNHAIAPKIFCQVACSNRELSDVFIDRWRGTCAQNMTQNWQKVYQTACFAKNNLHLKFFVMDWSLELHLKTAFVQIHTLHQDAWVLSVECLWQSFRDRLLFSAQRCNNLNQHNQRDCFSTSASNGLSPCIKKVRIGGIRSKVLQTEVFAVQWYLTHNSSFLSKSYTSENWHIFPEILPTFNFQEIYGYLSFYGEVNFKLAKAWTFRPIK